LFGWKVRLLTRNSWDFEEVRSRRPQAAAGQWSETPSGPRGRLTCVGMTGGPTNGCATLRRGCSRVKLASWPDAARRPPHDVVPRLSSADIPGSAPDPHRLWKSMWTASDRARLPGPHRVSE